jgi:hypothetical protein
VTPQYRPNTGLALGALELLCGAQYEEVLPNALRVCGQPDSEPASDAAHLRPLAPLSVPVPLAVAVNARLPLPVALRGQGQ